MQTQLSLQQTLKHYFGYERFREGQEAVIEQVLGGQDVFVLMPTGGGKSMCYQLPALLEMGVTVVISPLIALMQDQVMGLTNNGIPATFLNSTLPSVEQRAREQALLRGEYKLLYVAPERLVQMWDWMQTLQARQGIPRLVIDEAHCISEWGHDFRPEYRQIHLIRERLQGIPVTALTATATERVRADIIQQLNLQDPFCHTASFNRPNLYYEVREKAKGSEAEVMALVKAVSTGAVIIYRQSRADVEKMAQRLCEQGIPALPYHAGLDPEVRTRHQEQFIRDEVQVMVATVAFGMGINKPDVRLVIHYDLPKTMEGYYQESGRAGRDGQPSDCILFFSFGDRSKIEFFIEQKTDPQEQLIARQQLRQMLDYASSCLCRRKLILKYFSEQLEGSNCQNCDICLNPVTLEDRTVEAQKFLSCVFRVGERFGLKHIIDILRGSKSKRIQELKHDQLSTYGIGTELSGEGWKALGRALLQQNLLQESQDGYPTLSLTADSWEVLRGEAKAMVPALQVVDPVTTLSEEIRSRQETLTGSDQDLFQQLRRLRKQLADERSVPPYIILQDRALREMATLKPKNLDQLGRIHGIGSRKLSEFGDIFLRAIYNFVQDFVQDSNEIEDPKDPSPDLPKAEQPAGIPQPTISPKETTTLTPTQLTPTQHETLRLYRQGLSPAEIAQERGLAISTISGHLAALLADPETASAVDLDTLVPPERQRQIFKAIFALQQFDSLASIQEYLSEHTSDDYTYEEIRFVRAALFQQP